MSLSLSERIQTGRIDRPDEWTMDGYSWEAKKLENKIAELEEERDDFEALNSELYSIIFTHLGWWNLEGVNEIDHDDIIKALKEKDDD